MPLTGEYEPSTLDWARKQAEAFEASAGADANTIAGKPIILVTSVGAKSGKIRKTPLIRVEHNGEYVAIGSMGGAPKHPAWVHNLRAKPLVEVQDGAETRDFTVRELEGAERDEWWARSVETFPNYAEYQKKTERVIPVFLLTPA